MQYKELNLILDSFVEEEPIDEDEFLFIKQLLDIVLDTKLPNNRTKYHSKMRFGTSLNHSLNFLETLNPRYRANLESLFNNNQVTILKGNGLSQMTAKDGHSTMTFYQRGTVEDSYTLTHENIHDTNRDLNRLTVNWHLMTEAFSILSELLQRDYFSRLDNCPQDYRLNELDTLNAVLIKACQLDFEINLLCTYLKYGQINDYLFTECLINKSPFYIRWALDDFNSSIKQGDFNFSLLQRNIIGGIISSHMYERIKNKPSLIREFTDLNDSSNDMAFIDTLHYLDLDVVDSQTFELSQDSVKTLTYAYKNRVRGVF